MFLVKEHFNSEINSRIQLIELKENLAPSMTPRSPEDTQINLQPPWKDLNCLSHPSQTVQPPVFHHAKHGEACTTKRIVNGINNDKNNGLYVLHSNTLRPSTSHQSCSFLAGQTTKPCSPNPQIYKTIILRPVGTQPSLVTSQSPLTTPMAASLNHQSDRILLSNNDIHHSQPHSPCSSTCTENNTFV
ncbi:hypothetical protein ACTXT7_007046 [Hymenolepis weldensis]